MKYRHIFQFFLTEFSAQYQQIEQAISAKLTSNVDILYSFSFHEIIRWYIGLVVGGINRGTNATVD